MKRIIILFACMSMLAGAYAQNNSGKMDDKNRVALNAVVLDNNIPAAAQKQLQNKMQQVVTKGGCSSAKGGRFIMTCKVDVVSQDITPTAPPMHAYTLNITFFVGDGISGKLFSTTSVTAKGVGETEAKAYIAALKNVKVNDPALKMLVDNGKEKIIQYYNTECDFIKKDALTMADRKEWEAALMTLLSVPDVCKECYDQCSDLSVDIYKRMVADQCQVNIAQAKAEIAGNHWDEALNYLRFVTPDLDCYPEVAKLITEIQDHRCADALSRAQAAWASRDASEAAYWLAEVPADSKCYSEAVALQKSIGKNMDEKDAREWALLVKAQQDAVDIEKANIEAVRAIGVAFGENQQAPTYNVLWW